MRALTLVWFSSRTDSCDRRGLLRPWYHSMLFEMLKFKRVIANSLYFSFELVVYLINEVNSPLFDLGTVLLDLSPCLFVFSLSIFGFTVLVDRFPLLIIDR